MVEIDAWSIDEEHPGLPGTRADGAPLRLGGWIVVAHTDGYGERAAALAMLDRLPGKRPRTVAADKAYDTRDFVLACRQRHVTPHMASHSTCWGGTAPSMGERHAMGAIYAISQTIRKRIEEHFGWGKTVGRIRQAVYRGIERVDQHFKLTMTASNIVRMARLFSAMGPVVSR